MSSGLPVSRTTVGAMQKWQAEYQTGDGPGAERRTLIIEAKDEATARDVAEENTGIHEVLVAFGPCDPASDPWRDHAVLVAGSPGVAPLCLRRDRQLPKQAL